MSPLVKDRPGARSRQARTRWSYGPGDLAGSVPLRAGMQGGVPARGGGAETPRGRGPAPSEAPGTCGPLHGARGGLAAGRAPRVPHDLQGACRAVRRCRAAALAVVLAACARILPVMLLLAGFGWRLLAGCRQVSVGSPKWGRQGCRPWICTGTVRVACQSARARAQPARQGWAAAHEVPLDAVVAAPQFARHAHGGRVVPEGPTHRLPSA